MLMKGISVILFLLTLSSAVFAQGRKLQCLKQKSLLLAFNDSAQTFRKDFEMVGKAMEIEVQSVSIYNRKVKTIEGVVLDSLTRERIPYCRIYKGKLKKDLNSIRLQKIGNSDRRGMFKFDEELKRNERLFFVAVSYLPHELK